MFRSRFISVLSDKLSWTTACSSFNWQKMMQSPYFFFDVVYLHNGVEEAGDETSWRVSEQRWECHSYDLWIIAECAAIWWRQSLKISRSCHRSRRHNIPWKYVFHTRCCISLVCPPSPGQLHLILQPGLKGNVLPLWGFPERTRHRAAQLHGQTPGSSFTEAIPESCFLQPSGGGRPPGHWGSCLTCHSERPAGLKTHPAFTQKDRVPHPRVVFFFFF